MNDVAMCSKACKEARSNESLDQTRIGTIVCSESSTDRSIYVILLRWRQSHILSHHPIHVRIENASNVSPDPNGDSVTFEEAWDARCSFKSSHQSQIVSIDLSIDLEQRVAAADRRVDSYSMISLFVICEELRELGMSGVMVTEAG